MGHFIWDASPSFLSIGNLELRWYSLMFIVGFTFSYQFLKYIWTLERRDPSELDLALCLSILGAIIGARLGHCLFYDPNYYFSNPLKIFMVWEGGLASHGGFLGVFAGLYLWQRSYRSIRLLSLLDRVVIPAALFAALIRLGNFFNSEILGTSSKLPWAIIFSTRDQVARHPAQLYEMLAYLSAFAIGCWLFFRTNTKRYPGRLAGLCIIMMTSSRFLIEFLKENQTSFESNLPFLNIGQILSLPFFFAGLYLYYEGEQKYLELKHYKNMRKKAKLRKRSSFQSGRSEGKRR